MKYSLGIILVAIVGALACFAYPFISTTPPKAVVPFGPDEASRIASDWATYLDVPVAETNSIGTRFVLIPPGTLEMGSAGGEMNEHNNEFPRHRVRITKPFYASAHETTLSQFREFVEATGYEVTRSQPVVAAAVDEDEHVSLEPNDTLQTGGDSVPPWENVKFEQTDDHPVVNVTWDEAVAFCEWLSEKEGRHYRLLTEAEWEYACRAGTETMFFTGNSLWMFRPMANHADAALKADQHWSRKHSAAPWNDGYVDTAPVGSFPPNAFGLYDMHANAREWCSDWFHPHYYEVSPVNDPLGPESGMERVQRGGHWASRESYCRSARRQHRNPRERNPRVGFRVARDILPHL